MKLGKVIEEKKIKDFYFLKSPLLPVSALNDYLDCDCVEKESGDILFTVHYKNAIKEDTQKDYLIIAVPF